MPFQSNLNIVIKFFTLDMLRTLRDVRIEFTGVSHLMVIALCVHVKHGLL